MARFDLRLPDAEIGYLTLAQFDELLKRKKLEDNLLRLNAGIVAAAVINSFRAKDTEPISPLQFVPDWKDKVKNGPPDLRDMTPEEQKNYMMAMFMGGGKRNMK
jgi:hypothetical protein